MWFVVQGRARFLPRTEAIATGYEPFGSLPVVSGFRLRMFDPLTSEYGTAQMRQSRPDSGLGCLICSEVAGQRWGFGGCTLGPRGLVRRRHGRTGYGPCASRYSLSLPLSLSSPHPCCESEMTRCLSLSLSLSLSLCLCLSLSLSLSFLSPRTCHPVSSNVSSCQPSVSCITRRAVSRQRR